MNRKQIIDELNKLTLRYNLTWNDVKTDIDKAIQQINFLLGVEYPKASDILLHDDSTYTIRVDGRDVEIIKSMYFHSVVIPYVAMEILARDEEFTTIYSKYQQEYTEGKFIMFSNEFNNVPDRFKRKSDSGAGVLFPANNKGKRVR